MIFSEKRPVFIQSTIKAASFSTRRRPSRSGGRRAVRTRLAPNHAIGIDDAGAVILRPRFGRELAASGIEGAEKSVRRKAPVALERERGDTRHMRGGDRRAGHDLHR